MIGSPKKEKIILENAYEHKRKKKLPISGSSNNEAKICRSSDIWDAWYALLFNFKVALTSFSARVVHRSQGSEEGWLFKYYRKKKK